MPVNSISISMRDQRAGIYTPRRIPSSSVSRRCRSSSISCQLQTI